MKGCLVRGEGMTQGYLAKEVTDGHEVFVADCSTVLDVAHGQTGTVKALSYPVVIPS